MEISNNLINKCFTFFCYLDTLMYLYILVLLYIFTLVYKINITKIGQAEQNPIRLLRSSIFSNKQQLQ